jgi:hypothetical protein
LAAVGEPAARRAAADALAALGPPTAIAFGPALDRCEAGERSALRAAPAVHARTAVVQQAPVRTSAPV